MEWLQTEVSSTELIVQHNRQYHMKVLLNNRPHQIFIYRLVTSDINVINRLKVEKLTQR